VRDVGEELTSAFAATGPPRGRGDRIPPRALGAMSWAMAALGLALLAARLY
jgi:hypothetical protein